MSIVLLLSFSDFPSKYRSRGRLNKAELMLLPRYLKCLIFSILFLNLWSLCAYLLLMLKKRLKVVDCINKAPADLRPSVLVSATAVGYYGRSKIHI